MSNSHTDRYLSDKSVDDIPDEVKYTFKTKHAASVKVPGVVSSGGRKCPPIFVKNNEKVTSDVYIGLLEEHVLPWIEENFADADYVFQQDGAFCHTPKKTQAWLKEKMKNVWDKTMWSPSSPDLNPLDYNI